MEIFDFKFGLGLNDPMQYLIGLKVAPITKSEEKLKTNYISFESLTTSKTILPLLGPKKK